MSEEEFSQLSLESKWKHMASIMDYILTMDKTYESNKAVFSLRRRFNPHHPEKDVAYETDAFKKQQRNLRIDQYQRWAHVKNLYSAHRDEMANTLETDKYSEYKSILEKVFTMEVDDALRDIIDD
jgi:hypothetical protein